MNQLAPDTRVYRLQEVMRHMPQVDLDTQHYWAGGMYARAVTQPKDVLVVGKVHKTEHFFIVTRGCMQIGLDVYEAGTVLVCQPGTKRALLALEDSIYMTVHKTAKRNLEKLGRVLWEWDQEALFDAANKQKQLEVKP